MFPHRSTALVLPARVRLETLSRSAALAPGASSVITGESKEMILLTRRRKAIGFGS